jgi:hypothetical protein
MMGFCVGGAAGELAEAFVVSLMAAPMDNQHAAPIESARSTKGLRE